MKAFLGLDLGTGSLKAIVVDGDGRTLAIASAGYPLESRHPDWSETDAGNGGGMPPSLRRGRHVRRPAGRPSPPSGSARRCTDTSWSTRQAEPLRPAILWSDGRAESQRARYEAFTPGPATTPRQSVHAGRGAATLAWLAEHESATYLAATLVAAPKDWLRTRLVAGPPVTDASDASATLLWDVPADRWADDVIADLGLRSDMLPPVRASTADRREPLGRRRGDVGTRAGVSRWPSAPRTLRLPPSGRPWSAALGACR